MSLVSYFCCIGSVNLKRVNEFQEEGCVCSNCLVLCFYVCGFFIHWLDIYAAV